MIEHSLVLIADDEPAIREIYQRKLEQAGYRVVTASDGREAVEAARQAKPDLIVMDFNMPNMNGIDAVETLKNDPECSGIKVVFLTGMGDQVRPDSDVRAARSIGAEDFIEKSLKPDEFLERIQALIKPLK